MKNRSTNTTSKSSTQSIIESSLDIDYEGQFDGELDPKFYIHIGLINAQRVLLNPDIQGSMLAYRQLIENLWVIGKSFGIVAADTDVQLSDEENSRDVSARSMIMANKKLQVLLESISSTAPIKGDVFDREDRSKPEPVVGDVDISEKAVSGDVRISI